MLYCYTYTVSRKSIKADLGKYNILGLINPGIHRIESH
jgi:hypothetical protein